MKTIAQKIVNKELNTVLATIIEAKKLGYEFKGVDDTSLREEFSKAVHDKYVEVLEKIKVAQQNGEIQQGFGAEFEAELKEKGISRVEAVEEVLMEYFEAVKPISEEPVEAPVEIKQMELIPAEEPNKEVVNGVDEVAVTTATENVENVKVVAEVDESENPYEVLAKIFEEEVRDGETMVSEGKINLFTATLEVMEGKYRKGKDLAEVENIVLKVASKKNRDFENRMELLTTQIERTVNVKSKK